MKNKQTIDKAELKKKIKWQRQRVTCLFSLNKILHYYNNYVKL